MTRTIAVTSGRGGVGTTSIAIGLAAQLAQRGQRVCLLDAAQDGAGAGGPAQAAAGGLRDLAVDGGALDAVLGSDPHGFDILAGQDAAVWLGELDPAQRQQLGLALAALEGYDFVLIDVLGGIDPDLLGLVLASAEVIVTVTPQPARLREGYALVKLLAERQYPGGVSLLINRSGPPAGAERAYDSFREAAQQHLDRRVPLLGVVREDRAMQRGALGQASLLGDTPESGSAQDVAAVAAQLLREGQMARTCDMRGFAAAWLQAAAEPQPLPAVLAAAASCNGRESQRELQQQIEALSAQIDDLVVEINRLRAEGEDIARLVAAPGGKPRPATAVDIEAWVAGMASGLEQLRVGEQAFSVYHLRRSGGDLLRVAFHRRDAEPKQTEPQSSSP